MTGSIALTGGNGFLGWHTRVRGRAQGEAEITVVPLGTGVPVDGVAAAIDGAKRLLRSAGMNRGEPKMVRRVHRARSTACRRLATG